MTPASRPMAAAAALSGALGLIFCAFASHVVQDELYGLWLRIGGFCLILHALAALLTLVIVPGRHSRITAGLFLAGGLIFAVSLTAMAFGAPRWLGAVTPGGGLLMIIGWLALAWAFIRPARG